MRLEVRHLELLMGDSPYTPHAGVTRHHSTSSAQPPGSQRRISDLPQPQVLFPDSPHFFDSPAAQSSTQSFGLPGGPQRPSHSSNLSLHYSLLRTHLSEHVNRSFKYDHQAELQKANGAKPKETRPCLSHTVWQEFQQFLQLLPHNPSPQAFIVQLVNGTFMDIIGVTQVANEHAQMQDRIQHLEDELARQKATVDKLTAELAELRRSDSESDSDDEDSAPAAAAKGHSRSEGLVPSNIVNRPAVQRFIAALEKEASTLESDLKGILVSSFQGPWSQSEKPMQMATLCQHQKKIYKEAARKILEAAFVGMSIIHSGRLCDHNTVATKVRCHHDS